MTVPPFNAGKHPRSAGGRFGATSAAQSAAAGHPAGAWAAGPIQSGAAHNKGAPDARVRALQQALNRLGLGDERGHPLLVDGVPGAHTKAAIQRFQRQNGLPPSGIVDAKTAVAILTAKPPQKKPATARQRMNHHATRRSTKRTTKSASVAAPKSPGPAAPAHTGSVGGKEPPAFY